MELIQQKYAFSQKEPLGGLYEDAEFRNASYLAVRRKDGNQVQLAIYSSTKPGQIASYFKKVSKFAEVKHPCLTPILECTHDPQSNLLFVVLQWSKGYSLKEYLGSNFLHWKTAYNIIRDVLSGLSEMHSEGLVYSFMNLENIEVCEGRGRLSFRYFIYKTYYLSPEVKENHQKSKESDLFSTGVCLFRMIFGTLPFKTKSSGEYAKSVKGGVARKIPIEHTCFPHVMPVEVQQYINTLSHFIPAQRTKYTEHHKKLDEMVGSRELLIPKEVLGENYMLLSVQSSSDQYVAASVIDLSKRKHKDQHRIYHLQMIRHNLTEISTYVDDIINPFKNATNLYFANIHEFYVVQKDCLVIVYDYCSQGSLKDYGEISSFSKQMTEQASSVLRNLLSQWKGQYRFLTNQYVLVNSGRPVLKYPPFPTKDLKAKLKLSKKGNYFIAPEVEAGIQSITADSWSVGAIEYWMRFNSMPDFNEKGVVIMKDRSQMTAQKCTEMSELLCKKHRERTNLFPLESKPVDRKISSDSYSSSDSPRLSSRIKSVPNGNNAIRMNTVLEPNILELQEEVDEFQILTPNYDANDKKSPKMRKKVQSGANVMTKTDRGRQDDEGIQDFKNNPSLKLSKMKEMRSRNKKKMEKDPNGDNGDFNITQSKNGKKDSDREQISSSQLNLIDKAQQPSNAKPPINKRFPTFGGGTNDQKKMNKRSSIQQDRESTKFRKDSQYQKSQNSRRKTIQQSLGVEPVNMGDGLMGGIAKEAWRVAHIDKHWSKPIRVFLKGLIALIICVFAFYFSFFKINGDLMKSRYDFDTQLLYLRSDSVTSTPTINFTAVTRTPLETYNSLNNQTLTYIRDIERCVTNDYNNDSNVYQVISSGSFGTYQAFGFIIVIINLILLCLSLAKFDLPKALSMTSFDDHFYSPLYNWVLVNLALTSLTSCTYLNYGGLFDLKLDPCLSRSSFPSLTYLMKNEPSSFIWRFVWVYIGIVIAYVLIVYLTIKPKTGIPRYTYVCLILLYIAGVGVRAMGTYNSSLCSIFGACGELLTLFIGIPLLLIDLMVSCRLRKIIRSNTSPAEGLRGDELEATEQNFNVE